MVDIPGNWKQQFLKVERGKDKNGNEIPWDPPLKKGGFWDKPEVSTAENIKIVTKNKHTRRTHK